MGIMGTCAQARGVCAVAVMTVDRLSRAVRAGEAEDETAAAGHAFCYAGLHGAGRDALSRLSDNDAQYGGSQSVSVKSFTSNH